MIVSSAPSPEPARNTCQKHGGRAKRNGTRKRNSPASRPMTEPFSQFEPDALTRYLKPIIPRGQHTAQAKEYSGKRILPGLRETFTHADRLVSNGPPPHPIITMSKLGPRSTISPIIPLAVELEGDPGSNLPSNVPTLIWQNRCSRLRRYPYRSETDAKK